MSSFNTNFANSMFSVVSAVSKVATFMVTAVSAEVSKMMTQPEHQGAVDLNPPNPFVSPQPQPGINSSDTMGAVGFAACSVFVAGFAAVATYCAFKHCRRERNRDNVFNQTHYEAMQDPEYAVNNPAQVAVVVAPVATQPAQERGTEFEMCNRNT